MANQIDFVLDRWDDGSVNLDMAPPANLGGVDLRFHMWRRKPNVSGFVSGLILKSCHSGYGNGVSGITVLDSGAGRISIAVYGADLSGTFTQGIYAYNVVRFLSGQFATLVEGHRLMF